MLDCSIRNGEAGYISVSGNIVEIMSDIAFIVRIISEKLKGDDNAEIFEKFVRELLPSLAFNSKEELRAVLKEQEEKADDIKKSIKKIMDDIDKILSEASDE